MRIRPPDAWILRRLLCGHDANGELDGLPEPWKGMAAHLAGLNKKARSGAWTAMLAARPDREELVKTLEAIDPNGPPPVTEAKRRAAHIGDLAGFQSAGRFIWPSWLVRAHFNLLSSDPKIGKTHLALFIAWLIWFRKPWPDGQPPTFPEGTSTLWVCGDRHQDELKERAAAFGLPPEAVRLNTLPAEPYGGWDLDNFDNIKLLRELVENEQPGIVVIDTVWRATRRKLSKENEVNLLMDPIISIAQECDVSILGLMHLSKDAETLGRRLEGLARAILKMFRPDPGQPDRRRLEVIGNFKELPPLGVTIRDGGCDFDSTPPEEPARNSGGRPPEEREKARKFITDALASQNDRKATALLSEWEKGGGSEGTFWRAMRDMQADGDLSTDGGKGTGKPMIFHLILQNPQTP
ncbi:MAG: AAA family ATPase [Planctomycetaceae bacterium]|nr:AAA family ATPase [Planctomycetaceae bacterium]